jgi:hypothetical protein
LEIVEFEIEFEKISPAPGGTKKGHFQEKYMGLGGKHDSKGGV